MATNKLVPNAVKQTKAALKEIIEYILDACCTDPKYIAVWGPFFADCITPQAVLDAFMATKQLFEKNDGVLFYHRIISFHCEENVTPEQIMYIAKTVIKEFYSDFMVVYSVHFDEPQLHVHMAINSVSYITGLKLHYYRNEFYELMEFTNKLCCSLGLSLNERGKHFDGTKIEEGVITCWNQNGWKKLQSGEGYLIDCFEAVKKARERSINKEEFTDIMGDLGWSVDWNRKTKKIIFENEDGKKVSNQKLEKTFHANASVKALLEAFIKNATQEREKKKKQFEAECTMEDNFYEDELEERE